MKIVSYSYKHLKVTNGNLGDAIQTLAVLEFFKKKDIKFSGFVNRENLVKNMFINGWHKYKNEHLPDRAIFCSIHADCSHLKNINKKYLIGCRDTWTQKNCNFLGLKSLMTGCITINFPISINKANKNIIFIDSIHKRQYTQNIGKNLPWNEQLIEAKKRIELLSQAALVHTTKLHILIPCIAMGIPVILDEIPGDLEGWEEAERFSFIRQFIEPGRVIEIKDGTRDQLLEIWDNNSTKVIDDFKQKVFFL